MTAFSLAAALALAAPLPELTDYDALWARRDDPDALVTLTQRAPEYAATSDPQKLWRASRWYLWISEDDTDGKRQHQNAELGMNAGLKGKKLDPTCFACGYWAAINVGVYALGLNVFACVFQGIEGKVRDPIEEAAASDPLHQNADLDYIGPQKSLGRYYFKLPWPKRNLKKSRELLELAVAARPDDQRARYFLIETLWAQGDKDTAKSMLAQLLEASPAWDPAEAKRVRSDAEALAKKLGVTPRR